METRTLLIWNSARLSVISYPTSSLSSYCRLSATVTPLVSFFLGTLVFLERSLSSASSDDHAWDHHGEDCTSRVSGQRPPRLRVCTLWLVSFRLSAITDGTFLCRWSDSSWFDSPSDTCWLLWRVMSSTSIPNQLKARQKSDLSREKNWSTILDLFFDYYGGTSP